MEAESRRIGSGRNPLKHWTLRPAAAADVLPVVRAANSRSTRPCRDVGIGTSAIRSEKALPRRNGHCRLLFLSREFSTFRSGVPDMSDCAWRASVRHAMATRLLLFTGCRNGIPVNRSYCRRRILYRTRSRRSGNEVAEFFRPTTARDQAASNETGNRSRSARPSPRRGQSSPDVGDRNTLSASSLPRQWRRFRPGSGNRAVPSPTAVREAGRSGA